MTNPAAEPAALTAPIPVVSGRLGFRAMFAALGAHNYRLYAISMVVGSAGGGAAWVAIAWLVLELTGNIALVGLVPAFQLAPTILLGAWAGVLADRYRRRTVLLVAQVFNIVAMGSLAVLAILGVAELWHIYLAAALSGLSNALDGPSRSAFLFEMVGVARLRNAISLTAMSFHLGGLIGPALSGLLIVAAGSGWSIGIGFVAAIVSISMIMFIRSRELARAPRQDRRRGQIREALRYSLRKPTIIWPLVFAAAVALFGMPLPILLAEAASDSGFDTGPAGYGLYISLAALGALIGAGLSTRARSLRLRTIALATLAYGLFTVFAGFTPWQLLFGGVLVAIGISRMLYYVANESMVQLSTNPGIRGRVLSFFVVVIIGGQAIGGVLIGWVAESFGMTIGFLVSGGVPALTAVAVAVILARRHQLRLQVNLRTPRRLVRVVRRGLTGPSESETGKAT